MTCGADFLYTIHHDKLKKWDKNTGEALDSLALDYPLHPARGGIDTDDCGNLYIGQIDSIVVYNSELVQVGAYEIPGACSDIAINKGKLYACGSNFVMQIDLDIFDVEMAATLDYCASCSGTATVDLTNCLGYELSSILWSPSEQITATATDLCAGWYEATTTWLTDSGELIVKTDSIEVLVTFESEFTLDLGNDTTLCEGDLYSLNAGPEFTSYLWQDGGTSQFYTADSTGLFWVEVLDEYGCILTDSIEITIINCLCITEFDAKLITVSPNPFNDYTTIYFGQWLTENHSIIIHNTLGQEVYRIENVAGAMLEIKKEQLGIGIYVLSILTANSKELFSTKLIVE